MTTATVTTNYGATATPLAWLWQNWIPLGKITLLAGDPGLGKSFLALDLAARLSTAQPMPHTQPSLPSPPHTCGGSTPIETNNLPHSNSRTLHAERTPAPTLLLSSEDSLQDTIIPRIIAQSGNPNLIFPIRALDARLEQHDHFSLRTDLKLLESCLLKSKAKLVILDPITSFMPDIDHNSTAHVRKHLTPLALLAERTGTAILAITHLSKESHRHNLYRATGSLALAAIARSVLLIHPSPGKTHGNHNLLTPIKTNLGEPQPSLPFKITNAGFQWLPLPNPSSADPTDRIDPTDPNLTTPDPFEHFNRQSAIDFLLEALKDGPKPSLPLIKEARQLLISERTLRRAKVTLNIQARKTANTWYWQLPQM